MKKTLTSIFLCSILSSFAFASEFVEINLTKKARLSSVEFSLFGACGKLKCKGAEIVVPSKARIAVEGKENASCKISKSTSLEFKGGDSYIIETELQLNSSDSCDVIISTRNQGRAIIQLVNVQAGTPRLTGSN